jgi:L-rhamnose mutarotase
MNRTYVMKNCFETVVSVYTQPGLENIFLFLAAKSKNKKSCVKLPAYIDFGERMDYGATQTHCDKQLWWTISTRIQNAFVNNE